MQIIVLADVYQRSSHQDSDDSLAPALRGEGRGEGISVLVAVKNADERIPVPVVTKKTGENAPVGLKSAPEDVDRTRADQKEPELAHWCRSRVRPLSADQLHLSVAQAFGYHFDENDFRLADSTGEEFTQDIPVNNLGSSSLTLIAALAAFTTATTFAAPWNWVLKRRSDFTVRLPAPNTSSDFSFAITSRRPTTEELEFFQGLGGEEDPSPGLLQDVVWVLLNSTEFVTNH